MPPLSLTQSKYAFAAFGMSVKSVPGCLVAMPPSLMGSPLAFLPLPSPHFEAAAAGSAAVVEVPLLLPPLVDALSLSSLPHAATKTERPATSTSNSSAGRHLSQPQIVL